MADMPPHFAIAYTPTYHSTIPANIDPSTVKLPSPFIAVVTGAGKGLGYHISLAFAKAGASGICISSRTQADLDTLIAEINNINKNVEVLSVICDTQSPESVLSLEKAVRDKWARCDVLVANAGVISSYISRKTHGDKNQHSTSNLPIGLLEDEDWSRVLNINLLGTWRVTKALLPLLIETTDGPQTVIVNTSLAAHSTDSSFTPIAYNVSKIAVNRLVEHVDKDHRGKDGVHAYALHPGAVLTPQTQNHEGEVWGNVEGIRKEGKEGGILMDDEGLAGAWCVWLGREKRGWLSGRYVSVNWDVEELEGKRGEIEERDALKFRMVV
ncbi:NAD(P)-binding protein [Amniculicola lignicola CBS 123094]|uniref:NAD(P)-binding protein n=1 Tax=Amniculicola lignicola CBS 123094 TaxID=1392246 RepID=A0A6A5WYV4_9PLEO|nr:NAD(P)-binding protein [Amniculicola lignicola CBS 123094]